MHFDAVFNRQKTRTVTRSHGTRILRFNRETKLTKTVKKIIQKFTVTRHWCNYLSCNNPFAKLSIGMKVVCLYYHRLTCIIRELSAKQPVEDVVVPLETRLLIRHTRLLQQIYNRQDGPKIEASSFYCLRLQNVPIDLCDHWPTAECFVPKHINYAKSILQICVLHVFLSAALRVQDEVRITTNQRIMNDVTEIIKPKNKKAK